MPMHFKYKELSRPEKFGPVNAPAIPITIFGKKRSIDTVGLVDSGADFSAIGRDLAELLGLDLRGKKDKVGGIGGESDAILTKMTIKVTDGKHESKQLTVKVYVIDDIDDEFPILIGRYGFFDKFKIEFIDADGKLILKEYHIQK